MTAIEATAEAKVFKGKWYKRPRYTMYLYVNDVNTGLHWHLKRREVATQQKALVDNAAEILQHYGLMEQTYAKVAGLPVPDAPKPVDPASASVKQLVTPDGAVSGPRLPALGSKVQLTTDLGDFKKGKVGTVTRLDELLPGYAEENQYPVRVAFKHGADSIELPLHLHEIEVAQ
jgi:hypothetical protein